MAPREHHDSDSDYNYDRSPPLRQQRRRRRESSSRPDRASRDREHGATTDRHHRQHRRTKSSSKDNNNHHHDTTASTSAGSGSAAAAAPLSMSALMQLNQENAKRFSASAPRQESPVALPTERKRLERRRERGQSREYRHATRRESRDRRRYPEDEDDEEPSYDDDEEEDDDDDRSRIERAKRRELARIKRERAVQAAATAAMIEKEREREREEYRERQARKQQKSRGRESSSRDKPYRVVDALYPDRGYGEEEEEEDGRGREKRKSRVVGGSEGVKRRVVSGAALEEGRSPAKKSYYHGIRGGGAALTGDSSSYDSWEREKEELAAGQSGSGIKWWRRKKPWILVGIGVAILILIIVVAVVVSKKNSGDDDDGGSSSDSSMENGGLGSISPDSIPADAPTWLNPFKWADTAGFNLTYTAETVGDLPVMGLFSKWDDSARANDRVPPLNKPWGDYAKKPARGVNVGGWLNLEPFITPSLFDHASRLGIIDEYTLCSYLGARAEGILEKHYSTFVTEDTFREIAEAGLDHVRIPFSYWAVQTYDGDPYVFRTSWRYLLRGIEWARKYGLRVNLDPHGLPGSQNGWNHSGRQGVINWLDGQDGDVNGQRSLEMHDRLSKFFAQPRYRNIITHYGLANEPKMTTLSSQKVLQWTAEAHDLVRRNGIDKKVTVVFGDGFRGLGNWKGDLSEYRTTNMALDVHQYLIFNTNQIVLNHSDKIRYACEGWTEQMASSMDPAKGYGGPNLVAEWSQADTDCAKHLTNVGWGNRWTGTYVSGDDQLSVTTPRCPTMDRRCDCMAANAPADRWTDEYKRFLKMFAEAQMSSFEKSWGWFYWVWDTEDAPQWSYKKGMAAGVLPTKAYEREFDCDLSAIPTFEGLPEYY